MKNKTDRLLGLDKAITRRDFLNTAALGAGAGLLHTLPPIAMAASGENSNTGNTPGADWYGPGGIGDYRTSHGNTPEIIGLGHSLRDGAFDALANSEIHDLDESYDVIIVGAGMAGLGAAYELVQQQKSGHRCLIIENHPIFGGESKRNEMNIDGHHLIGPQGANGFSTPDIGGKEAAFAAGDARYYEELKVPRQFQYSPPKNTASKLRFGRDNYGFIYWLEHKISTGHFFPDGKGSGHWTKNPLSNGFGDAPIDAGQAATLTRFINGRDKPYEGEELDRWLDQYTYKQVIEDILGYPESATEYMDPIVASAIGLGCDAVSAYSAYADALPGVNGYFEGEIISHRHSFPGGNDGFSRYFVKEIMPWAIEGDHSFEAILNGRVQFSKLDQKDRPIRMRLGATVVRVEHDGPAEQAEQVLVTYSHKGKLFRLRSKGVVMATGGWVNRHVVRDLPKTHHDAFNSFSHAPFLVANVALHNWRFLDKLGITACRYNGEFGFSCNLRQPMQVGDFQPPLDPNKPAMLNFYVPFYYPGQSAQTQGNIGRAKLLSTSYADYERQIRRQMQELFGASGFDASRDIAGIILNRWGHAYIAPGPGFFFGRNGQPAARDTIRQSYGRIAFGHSELRGNQHWGPAADEGGRAMAQVIG